MVYKRVRRSFRHKRDQEHFECCQRALEETKNVLGFMNRNNDLFYYPVIGMVDSQLSEWSIAS